MMKLCHYAHHKPCRTSFKQLRGEHWQVISILSGGKPSLHRTAVLILHMSPLQTAHSVIVKQKPLKVWYVHSRNSFRVLNRQTARLSQRRHLIFDALAMLRITKLALWLSSFETSSHVLHNLPLLFSPTETSLFLRSIYSQPPTQVKLWTTLTLLYGTAAAIRLHEVMGSCCVFAAQQDFTALLYVFSL